MGEPIISTQEFELDPVACFGSEFERHREQERLALPGSIERRRASLLFLKFLEETPDELIKRYALCEAERQGSARIIGHILLSIQEQRDRLEKLCK